MSRIFGAVTQAGYVVRDIEAAMRHWVEVLGVGPWFYAEHAPIEDFQIPPNLVVALRSSHHTLDLSTRYAHHISSVPMTTAMEMRHGTSRQSTPPKSHPHRRFPR